MFSLNDFEVKREQYQDFLREADKERLIRSLLGRRERSSFLADIREFVATKIEDSKLSMLKVRNAH